VGQAVALIQAEADGAGRVDWNVSVDSSIVRAHQHSASAKRSAREDRTVLVEHTGAVSDDKNPRFCRDEPPETPHPGIGGLDGSAARTGDEPLRRPEASYRGRRAASAPAHLTLAKLYVSI
jgi:hypothetical protein